MKIDRQTAIELALALVAISLITVFLAYGLPYLKANYENFFVTIAGTFREYIIELVR